MKKQKVFLGITSCILSIAAVTAAKVTRFSTTITQYYCTSTATHAKCLPFQQTSCVCITAAVITCFYYTNPTVIITSKKYTLYTKGTGAANATCGNTVQCKNICKYNTLQ